jgi:uncharacterized protein (DUF952 family)
VNSTMIYKVLPRSVWEQIRVQPAWSGSADDIRDGFIHFSNREQLVGTLQKHFAGQTDLVVLELDSESLGRNLKWEPSRNGALFPHLYAPMPIAAVVATRDVSGLGITN